MQKNTFFLAQRKVASKTCSVLFGCYLTDLTKYTKPLWCCCLMPETNLEVDNLHTTTPVDLYLISEKLSSTNRIFSLFRTWFLLLAVNPVPQTRFFQLDFSKFKCRSTGVRKYIRITYPSLPKNVGVWTRSHIKKKCFLPFQHFHTILRQKY